VEGATLKLIGFQRANCHENAGHWQVAHCLQPVRAPDWVGKTVGPVFSRMVVSHEMWGLPMA